MNYFAHGIPFLEQPYVLAGTAVPDWLSAADRTLRVRARHVEPFRDDGNPLVSAVAAGILQHHADDDWFHRTVAFYEVSGELARLFRGALGTDDGFRCGFLGHIVAELLLDAVLIERNPPLLDDYYAVMDSLDPAAVQDAVNRMARRPTERLAMFVDLFRREQFLRDYLTDAGLLDRLNQVMRRVRLPRLPEGVLPVLHSGRKLLRERHRELLARPEA